MITITKIVSDIIDESPFLKDIIMTDLANLSAIARRIEPEIKKRLWKTKVSRPAIIMALKRLQTQLQRCAIRKIDLSGLGDMTVRSNLVLLTYENTPALLKTQRTLLDLTQDAKENFLNVSQGLFETSLIVTTELFEEVKHLLKRQKPVHTVKQLSCITIRIPHQSTYVPGYFYNILRPLALDKINIVDITSVNREITLIFEDKDIEQAFTTLKTLQKLAKSKQVIF